MVLIIIFIITIILYILLLNFKKILLKVILNFEIFKTNLLILKLD